MVQAHIHLQNIQANAQTFKRIAPSSKLLAVLKANAYGHGVIEVATSLSTIADAFAVARLDEAMELNALALPQAIVILSELATVDLFQGCASHQFEPVLHSLAAVKLLSQATLSKPLNVWAKIDTGMHRLGLPPEDLDAALNLLSHCQNTNDIRLMTHLACADDVEPHSYQQQLAKFEAATGHYNFEKSICNSAASLRLPASHAQWLRPGIGLYGENPLVSTGIEGNATELKPTMTLSAPIIGIHSIKTGESVGYGDTWQAARDSRIATVAIGYADGYPRELPSATPTAVNGTIAPLAGRVSMDMITIDITDIDKVNVGDEVELWGQQISATTIAKLIGTIPYTLFCGLGKRVQRTFD